MSILEEKLKLLPEKPGVYVYLNSDNQVIYVGKAKILKNRVKSYFNKSPKNEKTMALVSNIADLYYYVVPSEIDALSLENNLIKKYKPRYNILLKDDKTYPYIKVAVKEDFPSFTITRKLKKDGAKYFGPFMGGISAEGVLSVINLAFNTRLCDKKINITKPCKPCLNYHIKRCAGVCAGLISKEEYREKVDKAIDFLNGETAFAEKLLKEKMLSLAENEDFELALKYKENLQSLEKIKLKRLTSLPSFINADIFSICSNGIYFVVSLLIVRAGRMIGGKNFSFDSPIDGENEGLLQFIMRYYKSEQEIPQEIIVGKVLAEDVNSLSEFLKKEYSSSVKIECVVRGVKKQLVDMATDNAKEHLETAVDRIKHKEDMTTSACKKLQTVLNLKKYPRRMECFDISNISGVDKVGSMTVFIDGVADKDSYRRFRIKTVEGANDFMSLREVLIRRLTEMQTNPDKFPKPDLIVIDGGKGQLSTIKQVFDEMNIVDIDLISLAERNEEIYTLYSSSPVVLSKSDYCLQMLQRIRDEAHRFAITYFRSIHSKKSMQSVLNNVEGLGKVKIKALIEKFKDLSGIVGATKEDLISVEGIGEKQAEIIIKALKEGIK